jgi:heptaprenyl diphosphate synthase
VIGALFHNLGQICIAMVILRSASILVYLPMLTISGILTGAFTGLCAWFASRRLRKDQVWFIR